jgi:hypothetical protein
MKRGRETEDESGMVVTEKRWLQAKLVCMYGFVCPLNAHRFAQTMGRDFYEWAKQNVLQKTAVVHSIAAVHVQDCSHFATFGAQGWRPAMLEKRPHTWFHLIHVHMKKDVPLVQLNQVASTVIVNDWPLAQVAFIDNKMLVTDTGTTIGKHVVKVDHSLHTDEEYHFVVKIKWQ